MRDAREALLDRIGRLPPPVPGGPPRVTRRLQLGDVALEGWMIEGPRGDIPAWFLSRDGDARPRPALLALHPHGRQFELAKSMVAGLAGEPSRAYGLAAARAGFAVLVPDLPGFEERRPPLLERKRNHALQGEAYERLLAMNALVQGSTLQAWILADLSACLGAMERDPRVEAARIGAIGQSFGGQETILGMLFDPRIKAGVSSCGFSLVRLFVERSISHNMALYLPGMLPGLDFDAILPALAPRPLMVIAGREDPICPIEGVESALAAARAAYGRLGASASLREHIVEGGHDLPPGALREALDWIGSVLGG
ncbi:MAG TPA: dienelactone hydrolase family protein [Candidatus Polarisedimenticolia bacterium]|nr:dienelactone hydrolase family protein [Candidatus Polarisedimenticolia bacterium]